MSFDVRDDSFSQYFDQMRPAYANNLNEMHDIASSDRSSVSVGKSIAESDCSEKLDQGNNSKMLRESKFRKHQVRANDECAASSDDERVQKVWLHYRPQAPINYSDLVEDGTIDAGLASPSCSSPNVAAHTFQPSEITGRSTGRLQENQKRDAGLAAAAADMSIEMILNDSFVPRIRNMSTNNRLDGTDDMVLRSSLPNKYLTPKSIPLQSTNDMAWNRSCYEPPRMSGMSVASDEFIPYDQIQQRLDQDEKAWQDEMGILPAESDRPKTSTASSAKSSNAEAKRGGKLVNLTEFSGYLADSNVARNNMSDFSSMSLGAYFGNRCEDVREMIPNRSPTKQHPIGLLDSYRTGSEYSTTSGDSKKYSQASSSFYTDDELKIKSNPRITNATYDKKSVMSVSSIAAKLGDDSKDSPATFVSKYTNALRLMSSKIAATSSASSLSAVGKSTDAETVFTTANSSIGMLAQMNSTRIEDEDKENKEGQHRNSSADTEVASEFSHYVGDLSSAASAYDSSFKELSPRRKAPAPTTNKRVGLDEPRPQTNLKRMRSPQPTTSIQNAQVHSPEANVKRSDDTSPPRGSPMRTNGEFHKRAESNAEIQNGEREFIAVPHRSPMDGSKFSLPNYGLRNAARALSQSPTAYPIRSSSQLSTNSEYSQNDGKFPLKANKHELTWECVKLQKSVTKQFVVKNTAHKRLTVKLYVTGPGFQIATGLLDQGPLVLQGNECRTVNVIFCPTVIGKAIGKVTFKPSKGWSDDIERSISLYGYGGNTTLQLQGIERGPIGVSFLKMGETNSIRSTTLQRVFYVYNKGPLNGMATISIKPKTNQYIHDTHIQIEPSKCVIKPDSSVKVTVTYKLRRKDLEKLTHKSCDVLTVATLEVIIGADPNRQRIATILTRCPNIPAPYRSLEFLVKDFANDEDFSDFGEKLDNIAELFNCFKTTDIALTINRTTLDETRDTCTDLSGIEESLMFRTLVDERVDTESQPYRLHSDLGSNHHNETWSVYPKRLIMDQMENDRKQLTIRNDFNKPQTFQVETNFRRLFTFTPVSGLVGPGKECKVDVQLKTDSYVPSDVKITVFIETDSIEIPVVVRPAPPPYMSYK